MSRRTEQRRAAVFVVYQHDVTGRPLHELFPRDATLFTRSLAHATADHQDELDVVIGRHSRGWTVARISPLERSIMRVGLLEMLHPDVATGDKPIPPEGAIDEAIETTKEFCGADAPKFVNGVLAAALREHRASGAAVGGRPATAPEAAAPADAAPGTTVPGDGVEPGTHDAPSGGEDAAR